MFKPLNTYLIVEIEVNQEVKTSGGLYVPPTVTNDPNDFLKQGTVIEINSDCKGINVGDIVYFNKRATIPIPNNPTLKIVRYEDLYMVEILDKIPV